MSDSHFSEDDLPSFPQKSIDHTGKKSTNPTTLILGKVAALSALFHDLGKSTDGFQKKLSYSVDGIKGMSSDPIRHEFASALLLYPILENKIKLSELTTKEKVRGYFLNIALPNLENTKTKILEIKKLEISSLHAGWKKPFSSIFKFNTEDKKGFLDHNCWNGNPEVSAIIWLCLCHHKIVNGESKNPPAVSSRRVRAKKRAPVSTLCTHIDRNYIDHNRYLEIPEFISFSKENLWDSEQWCNTVANLIGDLEDLKSRLGQKLTLTKHFSHSLFYKAKTALIYADQLSSSEKEICQDQDPRLNTYANTIARNKVVLWGDSLYAHTIKVFNHTSQIYERLFINEIDYYKALPCISLGNHPSTFTQANDVSGPFNWQSLAYNALSIIDKDTGFLGIVVSGTGSGKTKGCPQIISALSRDMRFTLALGRKTLTQQAFKDYTHELIGFNPDDLAILVGQNISKNEHRQDNNDIDIHGSASTDDDETFDFISTSKNSTWNTPLSPIFEKFGRTDTKELNALSAPVTVMTIDHIIRLVTQTKSAHGKMILLAMNNDLILDEIDDFNVDDLISIAKIIHLFASFGRKVLISSATINPRISEALSRAYYQGYELHKESAGLKTNANVAYISNYSPYVEINEYKSLSVSRQDYLAFVEEVAIEIRESKTKRIAKVLTLPAKEDKSLEDVFSAISSEIREFNAEHYTVDDSEFKLSIGFVRFNNVDKSQKFFNYLTETDIGLNKRSLNYHSKMMPINRLVIEDLLDDMLKRNSKTPFDNDVIKAHVARSKEMGLNELCIIVSTTAIQETGRDHDYDWIISEPVSDKSIVQSAGRLLRHRDAVNLTYPNFSIFSETIKQYLGSNAAWGFPGIETEQSCKSKGIKYKVSFNFSKLISDSIDKLIIEKSEFTQEISTKSVLSNAIYNVIDARTCLLPLMSISDSLIGALETVQIHDKLLSDESSTLIKYTDNPLSNLTCHHVKEAKFRDSKLKGLIDLDIVQRKPLMGLDNYSWIAFKKMGKEIHNIEVIADDSDYKADSLLLEYDFSDKFRDVLDNFQASSGSLEKALSTSQIAVSEKDLKIYYSVQLGFYK